MHIVAALAGAALLLLVLVDAFETIVLPRRIGRAFRIARLFYRITWPVWRGVGTRLRGRMRGTVLSWYGPLSLLVLLSFWALLIVIAFTALQWAAGSELRMSNGPTTLVDDLYFSSTTLFTLMMGDETPAGVAAKWLAVLEAGIGFGLLAVVIGYLPVIYQTFSRREQAINMLDSRAGSPPSAGELLRRHRKDDDQRDLTQLLSDWERWAADVLESHLSYPAVAYFRSQHANQSWLAALTAMLDTSALVIVGFDGWCVRQAHLTFAMARHAVVDLAQVFGTHYPDPMPERLDDDAFAALSTQLRGAGIEFAPGDSRRQLADLRAMYEPYVVALGRHLALPIPGWTAPPGARDNWEGAPWKLPGAPVAERREHF